MPATPDQNLETWIASRKQVPPTDLSRAVMEVIREKPEPLREVTTKGKPPAWLVAFGCLLAGVGKLSLVFHLAF